MALFKISKGLSASLPSAITEGYCWYTYNDSKFYIDFKDEKGVLTRKALNAQEEEKLTGYDIATILESSDVEIPTSKAVMDYLTLDNLGIYIGPDKPTDENIKIWINTSEEGTGVIPVLPRIATITLDAGSWTGGSNPWSQVVEIPSVSVNSKIDLQPTAQQIVALQNADIALMAENNNGIVTVYALGGKPTVDYTMQVLLTEVAYV
jgi:hypothetical protein